MIEAAFVCRYVGLLLEHVPVLHAPAVVLYSSYEHCYKLRLT